MYVSPLISVLFDFVYNRSFPICYDWYTTDYQRLLHILAVFTNKIGCLQTLIPTWEIWITFNHKRYCFLSPSYLIVTSLVLSTYFFLFEIICYITSSCIVNHSHSDDYDLWDDITYFPRFAQTQQKIKLCYTSSPNYPVLTVKKELTHSLVWMNPIYFYW